MAFASRRRNSKKVTVYYWNSKANKQVSIPRSKTKHLDGLTDAEVDAWVEEWEKGNGLTIDRIMRKVHLVGDDLQALWDAYKAAYKARRPNVGPKVQSKMDYAFDAYFVPYFIGKHSLKDVWGWTSVAADFPAYMAAIKVTINGVQQDLNTDSQKKVLWLLMRFSQYLESRGKIAKIWVFEMPSRGYEDETPLRYYLQPEEALAAAKALLNYIPAPSGGKKPGRAFKDDQEPDKRLWALALLVGYFAGLSPSETFGLQNEDFVTGPEVETLCSTYKGLKKAGLGTKMAIAVQRALTGENKEQKYGKTKNKYRKDYACVWSADAAKLLATILKDLPAGPIYSFSRRYLDSLYSKHVSPLVFDVTQHDLRRASCAFLGDESGINLELKLLKKVMRHSVITTTLRYTRRPTKELQKPVNVRDLDDIG